MLIKELQSIIIVDTEYGYVATARFSDPKLDFIASHQSKPTLHYIIEQRIMWRGQRRKRGRR